MPWKKRCYQGDSCDKLSKIQRRQPNERAALNLFYEKQYALCMASFVAIVSMSDYG